ncbi:MAG: urease accessory protein UreF [Rubrimonas sp.]
MDARPAPETLSPDAALKLAAWLSPGYPVGAFSYSHGLEWLIEAGEIADAAALADWLAHLLRHGGPWSDAVLLAHAWRAPADPAVAELATALTPSRERRLETCAQGAAFAAVTAAAWPAPGLTADPAPYPVAVGRAAAAHAMPLAPVLAVYLHAVATNLIAAAVRLVPLGQTDGQRVAARLAPVCAQVAGLAAAAGLDELGGFSIRSDIAAMRHETQGVRLFRT